MSNEVNIGKDKRWHQGEDGAFIIPVVDADGDPVNMTGFELCWFLFTDPGAKGSKVGTWSTDAGTITVFNYSGTNDAVRITIDDEDTIATNGDVVIPAMTYWHELWRVDDADERILANGQAVLLPSRRRQEVS